MARRLRPASLYPRRGASVIVPLALFGLPEEIEAIGERWEVKDEFHVTAVDPPWVAQRLDRRVDDVVAEVDAALQGRRVGPVRVGDELRLVRRGGERTIVVMARVDGFGELYAELGGRLGAPLEAPPAHITLYTRPGGQGIGLHDAAELAELSEPLEGGADDEVRSAVRFGSVLG